ncbi:MAG: FtsX-like permease family protein, partial [Eubacteriales bacterium]|nr:FtsX-like permease family protein [Eubacteriales bacterium]
MKKRFTVSTIALQNIRGRKKAYVLLTIAIVLAIYFVATVLLFTSMLVTSLDALHVKRYGSQDIILPDCKDAPLQELVANGALEEYGTARAVGYALVDKQSRSGGFSIASFDDTALRLAGKTVLQGRLPEREGEIAVESSLLARLRGTGDIGGKLTLTLQVPDGTSFLENTVEKTYTLTGILADQRIYTNQWDTMADAYDDYPGAIVSAGEQIEPGGSAVIKCYGAFAGDAQASYAKAAAFCLQYGLVAGGAAANLDNTHYAGVLSGSFDDGTGETYDMVFSSIVIIVMTIILVFAACLGIVNAFTTNLEQRRRQIGLLRAVGATKKQIRDIFGREALLLAAASVPMGLGLAALTVWGAARLLGGDFVFAPEPPVLLAVAAAGILCVALAAAIPLRRASAIPPMQAIRDVALSRRMKKRSVKIRRQFDVPRLLAHRSVTLYPNRRLGVTALLAVSIVLIGLLAGAMGPQLHRATRFTYNIDYTLGKTSRRLSWLMEEDFHAPGVTEQDRMDAAALPGVARVYGQKILRVKLLVDRLTPYLTADGYADDFTYLRRFAQQNSPWGDPGDSWAITNDTYLASREKYGYQQDYLTVDCVGLDQEIIEGLSGCVSQGAIDPGKLSSGEEVLIVAPTEYGFRVTDTDSNGLVSGTTMDYTIDPSKQYLFTAKNDFFRAGDALTLSLLYTAGEIAYDFDNHRTILPDAATRVDKTVTIGAVLELQQLYETLNNGVLRYNGIHFYGNYGVLTTNEGLTAMGFDVPYETLGVKLGASPAASQEEVLTKSLQDIAAKTPDAQMTSFVAMARENRNTLMQVLVVCGAMILLFFSLCASMVNNALAARIRASRREIGTLRAVGASHRVIVRSYLWQLLWMFLWGVVIGMAAEVAISAWLLLTAAPGSVYSLALWQPLLFV